MSIVKIILLGLTFYFLYKVVFGVVLPVYRTTKQVRKGFQDMQSRMNEYQNETQQQPGDKQASSKPDIDDLGEYIDFEEIKSEK